MAGNSCVSFPSSSTTSAPPSSARVDFFRPRPVDVAPSELEVASPSSAGDTLSLRRDLPTKKAAMRSRITPTPTPTPIPILVAVGIPLLPVPDAVALDVAEDVALDRKEDGISEATGSDVVIGFPVSVGTDEPVEDGLAPLSDDVGSGPEPVVRGRSEALKFS